MAQRQGFTSEVIFIGLLAGVMDLTGATISYALSGGTNPVRILYYIASGVFGPEAFTGGPTMAWMGFGLRMFNAMCFTVFFFLLYPAISRFVKSIYMQAILYGAFVWCLMNLIVVPLSRVNMAALTLRSSAIAMVILMICIGLPVCFGARRVYSGKSQN